MLQSQNQSRYSLNSSWWLSLVALTLPTHAAHAVPLRQPDQVETCEILVAGGGLAGTATAYEALLAGRTVCMTEITDWVGGQATSQGVSALDESGTQVKLNYFPRGYKEFRDRIKRFYGRQNPGECWVSHSCFVPRDGQKILQRMLQQAARQGGGQLKWYPNTVIKELDIAPTAQGSKLQAGGQQIRSAIAIQHKPQPHTSPINTEPLSKTIEDAYRYENSPRFAKAIVQFVPAPTSATNKNRPADWYVVEATETGELIALADVPYRLGIDPRSAYNPSSASATAYPYCAQGFTYTFAMQHTEAPQTHTKPPFYDRYTPYYSYGDPQRNFNSIFTYRRMWSSVKGSNKVAPGDITQQNWETGNDYRPGTPQDNLIYSRKQLQVTGQLQPGGWMGGLRTQALAQAEELAIGFFYWLVASTSDAHLGEGVKQPEPNNLYLTGLDSPMGTVHGLSKYPYIRDGRRIIGRLGWGYPEGFSVSETDFSGKDFQEQFYSQHLSADEFRRLWVVLAGLRITEAIRAGKAWQPQRLRTRAVVYPDSVGIGYYAIDFHVCMKHSPPYAAGNTEWEEARLGHDAQPYPFQIPLRAMIPQRIDNLLVTGKNIATSNIAAAAYRVHGYEWSSGAAAGTVADFALEKGILPYQLVDRLPQPEPELELLQRRLQQNQNPIAFPKTSIFNNNWANWKVWGG